MQFDIEAIIKQSKDVSYNFKSEVLRGIDLEYSRYFMEPVGEHYRLLTAMASLYPLAQFLDLGTFKGASALAYLYGKPQKPIYSYDVQSAHSFIHEDLFDRIILKKENVASCVYDIGKIDIILLDISHNGDDEAAALRNLDKQGILKDCMIIFDDIHLNENMQRLWDGCEGDKKYDITKDGHGSGTGILIV